MTTSKSSDEKTAGADKSKTQQTTKQAEEQKVPTKVEERGESDVEGAASGNVAGGVVRGDTAVDDSGFADGKADGSLGTVVETNRSREAFDVPWSYLTAEDVGERTSVRTSDSDDPARSWTSQEAGEREDQEAVALTEVVGEPGQTFRVDELPNVEVMKAAGIDPGQWLAGVPVRANVPDEGHRRGIPA